MFLRKLVLASTMVSLISLFTASLKTNADPISDYYIQGAISANQARIQRWNSYTLRQKQLARAVGKIADAYYQQTQKPLPVTNQSIILVMNTLGATPQEAAFIKDRMIANSNAQAVIPGVDAVINRTQNFLNCLNIRTTGCIP